MEIKVGEYVRTNQGYIAKLEDIDKEFMYFDNVIMCYYEETKLLPINVEILDGTFLKAEDYITKHSFNIAEILEEDDYVNGMRVSYVRFPNDPYEPTEIYVLDKHINFIFASDIKSVVTHEQMEAMEYVIKEG